MNPGVVVLDYDGTIATSGELAPDVRSAIVALRAAGITVILATGRILSDLQRVMGDLRLLDAVVAENGAVLAFPDTGRSTVLGRAPAKLVDRLRQGDWTGRGVLPTQRATTRCPGRLNGGCLS